MNSPSESVEPFVSVVLPNFNSRATIGDCLTSLETQSYPRNRFEIIVADNGSTDRSPAWIKEHFPAVRMVHAMQKGSASARNAGFRAAIGEWVLSTDSDCIADSRWIMTLVRAMQQASAQIAALGGTIIPYQQTNAVERYRPSWVSQPDLQDPNSTIRYTATPNAIFKRAAVEEIGGFDASAGHDDTDMGLCLSTAGYCVGLVPEAIVRHRNPVTVAELYEHRLKYGERNFILAQKHPTIFGNPVGAVKRRQLLRETVFRIAKDLVKLPLSIAYRPRRSPVGWPVLDAVMAWGNYKGYEQASLQAEKTLA